MKGNIFNELNEDEDEDELSFRLNKPSFKYI